MGLLGNNIFFKIIGTALECIVVLLIKIKRFPEFNSHLNYQTKLCTLVDTT